jgi:predicted RNase H-like HicB family nuclease
MCAWIVVIATRPSPYTPAKTSAAGSFVKSREIWSLRWVVVGCQNRASLPVLSTFVFDAIRICLDRLDAFEAMPYVQGMESKTLRVVFEPESDGWWTVTVPSVRGCHTQAKSIEQGLSRIREALSLFIDNAESVKLDIKPRISATVLNAIKEARRKQVAAEKAQAQAAKANRAIVHQLRSRFSVRDVAKLLNLSPGRIGQLEHD